MEFQDVVRRRRMVRRYADRPVDRAAVERVLANAVHAPSAGFSQGWAFLLLDAARDVDRFWAATTPAGAGDEPDSWLRGMRTAPVVVVPLSNKSAYLSRYAEGDKGWTDRDEARWPVPYWDVDTGMAALLMLLTAVDEGLGGLFFGVPAEEAPAVRERFGIPADRSLVGVVALGYALPDRRSPSLKRGRRGPDQVVHRGRFGRH